MQGCHSPDSRLHEVPELLQSQATSALLLLELAEANRILLEAFAKRRTEGVHYLRQNLHVIAREGEVDVKIGVFTKASAFRRIQSVLHVDRIRT